MALPPRLLQGLRDIGFPTNRTPLEDVGAAARLRTILTSRSLPNVWDEYDRMAASDDWILSALGRGWYCDWHPKRSITIGLRHDYIQHPGYGFVPFAPDPPDNAALRRAVEADADTQYVQATRVLVRRAAVWDIFSLHFLRSRVGARPPKFCRLSSALCATHGARLHVLIAPLPIAPWAVVLMTATPSCICSLVRCSCSGPRPPSHLF